MPYCMELRKSDIKSIFGHSNLKFQTNTNRCIGHTNPVDIAPSKDRFIKDQNIRLVTDYSNTHSFLLQQREISPVIWNKTNCLSFNDKDDNVVMTDSCGSDKRWRFILGD